MSQAELARLLRQGPPPRMVQQPQMPPKHLFNRLLTNLILSVDENCKIFDRITAETNHGPAVERMRARFKAAHIELLGLKARALVEIEDEMLDDIDKSMQAAREDYAKTFDENQDDEKEEATP
jgi:hypothetical protein